MKKKWIKMEDAGNHVLEDEEGKVYLSYQPNKIPGLDSMSFDASGLDSANPETAIVLVDDKEIGEVKTNRYLIYRGDWRGELEKIFPDIEKLKEHWKKHGGHF